MDKDMKYVALLRGINVGTNNRIDMKSLKSIFEKKGYCNVTTYINTGNVIYESDKPPELLVAEIESGILEGTGARIPVLVKTVEELAQIVAQAPADWKNDTDVPMSRIYLTRPTERTSSTNCQYGRSTLMSDIPLERCYGMSKGARTSDQVYPVRQQVLAWTADELPRQILF
jgi:hypothetical protein